MVGALRVTCFLLIGFLPLIIGCGTSMEGLLGTGSSAEEEWNPVYEPVTSVHGMLLGASNGVSNKEQALEVTSGAVEIDTDAATITVGDTVYAGKVRAQADGPEVAEFTFGSINLGSDVTVTTKGARVLSLISHGDAVIATTLDVSGGDGSQGVGGTGRLGGGRGGNSRAERFSSYFEYYDLYGEKGQGKGGGDMGSVVGGGGFGGAGGGSESFSFYRQGSGGKAYGNLASILEGGSGGATGMSRSFGHATGFFGGGGGGGCVAIKADGELRVSGSILANGGNGAISTDSNLPDGAGGSGGGILLSGQRLTVTGTISAKGGNASRSRRWGESSSSSSSPAGAGGGGHILLHVNEWIPEELTLTGTFVVSGGTSADGFFSAYRSAGGSGRLVLQADQATVHTGQKLTLQTAPDRIETGPGRSINFTTGTWYIEDGGELVLNPWTSGVSIFLRTPVVLEGGTLTIPGEVILDHNYPITGHGTIAANVYLGFDGIITGVDGQIKVTGSITGYGTVTNVVGP